MSESQDQKDAEIARLRMIIDAYEKVAAYGTAELIDASKTIEAHENVQQMSREEILLLRRQLRDLESQEADRQRRIKRILAEDPLNEDVLLVHLDELRKKSDRSFTVDLFRVLVHYEFTEDEAETHWLGILDSMERIGDALGRPVSFRVAMMDYFVSNNRLLQNPMIIEISIFDELLKSSLQDELTQLHNRRYYDLSISREVNRARRHSTKVALLLVDIDDFKKLNDTHGHAAGDEALRLLGDLFRESFRSEDVPCRFGGEEFAVLLPETDARAANIVAERFRERVAAAPFPTGQLTISGGIAQYPDNAANPTNLLIEADRALYRAKLSGKNRIVIGESVAPENPA